MNFLLEIYEYEENMEVLITNSRGNKREEVKRKFSNSIVTILNK